MGKTAEKTSTWLALRNPVFRKLWLAMVVSGSCIGAHNTAAFWALDSLGASTVLISLMATVSALPYTLFTLTAGAIADMVDRKKILLAVQSKKSNLFPQKIRVAVRIGERRLRFRFRFAVGSFDRTHSSRRTGT